MKVSLQKPLLLLVSGAFIIIGFFLPWFKINGQSMLFPNNVSPTGIDLIVKTFQGSGYGLLLCLFLVFIPACSAINIYYGLRRNPNEKAILFLTGLSIFCPVICMAGFFFLFETAQVQALKKLLHLELRINNGMLIMLIGIGCYLLYIIQSIMQKRGINSALLLKTAIYGGTITGALFFGILALFFESAESVLSFYIFILGGGIFITSLQHSIRNRSRNYADIILVGLLVSAIFLNTLYLLSNVFYTDKFLLKDLDWIFFIVIANTLVAFVFASLSSVFIDH